MFDKILAIVAVVAVLAAVGSSLFLVWRHSEFETTDLIYVCAQYRKTQ